ncbi:MAG TPA: DUF4276 family protein [Ktedonobacteraceae bacterium]|nr:DUF4276 family protein [Ktedonobacteraceae bacterium]
MEELRLALYAEGTTDEQFLPSILQRTCEQLIAKHNQTAVNVVDPRIIARKKNIANRDESILQAAREAIDFHILVIHADADSYSQEKALKERFQPGYELVKLSNEQVCKYLVPVVPIYMTEAWLLADNDALRKVIGTNMKVHELGLVQKARLIEADSNPKQTLKNIVQKAYANRSRRHQQVDLGILYRSLGRVIRLEQLENLKAYNQFVHDLTATLKKLALIP